MNTDLLLKVATKVATTDEEDEINIEWLVDSLDWRVSAGQSMYGDGLVTGLRVGDGALDYVYLDYVVLEEFFDGSGHPAPCGIDSDGFGYGYYNKGDGAYLRIQEGIVWP
jgi:hypothetical protein